ncbi:hypothetical protein C5167_036477 [Papaver somniferum]|uniref:Uncharacterized protein n=1 Tax=Papaver somniferum TaxID=3469 RepID=A0A4Y7I7U8_PAPSO|nr:hypothetical protein C5167_036477 [Papaver somniferum]
MEEKGCLHRRLARHYFFLSRFVKENFVPSDPLFSSLVNTLTVVQDKELGLKFLLGRLGIGGGYLRTELMDLVMRDYKTPFEEYWDVQMSAGNSTVVTYSSGASDCLRSMELCKGGVEKDEDECQVVVAGEKQEFSSDAVYENAVYPFSCCWYTNVVSWNPDGFGLGDAT